jgi:hypothetical protein
MFDWMGVSKSIGGNLIGTSPEFELALYTMAFLSGCAILCAHVFLTTRQTKTCFRAQYAASLQL